MLVNVTAPRRLAALGFGIVALVALAGRVESRPSNGFEGDWEVQGQNNVRGAYTGSVKIEVTPDQKAKIISKVTYTSGGTGTWTANGAVAGDTIQFSGTASNGLIGGFFSFGRSGPKIEGSYKLSADGKSIQGSWKSTRRNTTSTETLTREATAGSLLTLVDGNGADVTGQAKVTKGVVLAPNIDDDDGTGGRGGDGETAIAEDKDRTGIAQENDLLPFKLKVPAGTAAGATWKLELTAKLAVWKTKAKDAGSRIESGRAFPAQDLTLYVEGVSSSAPGEQETLKVALEQGGRTLEQDLGKVTVARTAFLLCGHGNAGRWTLDSWLSSNKLDRRTDPVIVMGKAEGNGKPSPWAVYIWNTEKQAKIALSVEGAVIAYDGHSNFGMGFAFQTDFTAIRQFMNIADPQVTVNWPYLREHQDHPRLMIEDSEYGDDASTPTFSDPVQVSRKISLAHANLDDVTFPERGGRGVRCTLTRGREKWQDKHFGDGEDARIVIKAGARDMPAKRWSRLFLNSCYSAQYYFDSFGGAGTVFFTTDESSSGQTSAAFIEGFIQGKTNEQVMKDVNKLENINDYKVFSN